MRRALLAFIMVLLFSLSGCLSEVSVNWGNGSGEVSYDSQNNAVSTGLGPEQITYNLDLAGCENSTVTQEASVPLKFTGYLAESRLYEYHSDNTNHIDNSVAAAVVVNEMSFSDAESVREGEGARIPVKDWTYPLNPETNKGTVDLDSNDLSEDFFVLGLIPQTENILNGFSALQKNHQAVTISGYIVYDYEENPSTNNLENFNSQNSGATNCEVRVVDTPEGYYVVVTKITLESGVVSSDGESSDEWKMGQMPLLGRNGFVMFMLITLVAGGGGAFFYSNSQVVRGADKKASVLLGEKGMIASARAKAEAKAASKKKPAKDQYSAPEPKPKIEKPKPQKKKEQKSSFDIDAALSTSSNTNSGPSKKSKSSVVASQEAKQMDAEIKSTSETRVFSSEPRRSSSVVSSSTEPNQTTKREHFSSMSNTSSPKPAAKQKKVRKTRSVKKAAEPEPEPAPEPVEKEMNSQKFWEEEEEEFEDFSL